MNNNLHRSTDVYTRYHTNATTPQSIDAEQLITTYKNLEEIARSVDEKLFRFHQTIQRTIVDVEITVKILKRSQQQASVPTIAFILSNIFETFFDPHYSQVWSEVQQHKQTGTTSNNKKQTRPILQKNEL